MIKMSWEIDKKIEHIELDTTPKLPKVEFEGKDGLTYIVDLIRKGMRERKLCAPKDVYRRTLNKELKLIKKYNFVDYFAIVADLVNWCRKQGCMLGQ